MRYSYGENKKVSVLTDFFLSVKKERRLGSSLEGAGSVCERDAGAAVRARSASSHHDISLSSCACSRNSAPIASLQHITFYEQCHLIYTELTQLR